MAVPHVIAGASETAHPDVRRITLNDLADALRKGVDDFRAMPSHVVFLSIIYPIVGVVLGRIIYGADVVPLLFPVVAGFALIGPFAAIGLYELSRRREQGLAVTWKNAFDVVRAPSFDAILALGALLTVIFLIWLATAQSIYQSLFGYGTPESLSAFARDVIGTPAGHALILLGNGVGFLFAVVVLTISVVSFPLLLDREVGAAVAVLTSVRAVAANPVPMAVWGLIVAAALVLGSLPFLFGLALVMPILAHATWHLYRKVVVP